MRTQRILAISALVAAGFTTVAISWSADPVSPVKSADRQKDQPLDENKWMQMKLHASQEIFAAMTRGDAKAIETPARRMLLLNVLEQWKSNKPYMDRSEYEAQLNAFEYAVKELARTGRDENINGALEAYLSLTRSCVKCHQVIRDPGNK